tara:strand:- start:214 stop:957 length:744 start_codon:yes stop_codon:yes gene_type:complete
MKLNLKNNIALITGGTQGIGKAIVDEFLNAGAKVIVTGRQLNETQYINKNKNKNIIKYFQVDFADSKNFDSFLIELKKIKRIDICINNAGINKIDYLSNITIKNWEDHQAVNLTAPLRISQVVINKMKKNNYGKIINISSIWGKKSKEQRSLYSITKYGIHGLTVSSSIELARYNILINSISPGFIDTKLTRKNLSKLEISKIIKTIPIQRMAKTKEVSPIILFLSSKTNTYITGQNIFIDGGFINA